MDKERNLGLLKEYKKLSYKELDQLENDLNISYNNYVIVAIARALKGHEEGEKGLPLEEAFNKLLGEEIYNKNCSKSKSTRRYG